MPSKNITLTMPEEVVRRAKVLAAQRGTSVSGLVSELLQQVTGPVEDYGAVWAAEERAMAEGVDLRIGIIDWSRDELHER